MLEGNNKNLTDRLWNLLARPLVILQLTPNQVTLLGLVLVLANCGAYLAHRNPFWYGLGLIVSLIFDGLDGAVARLRGLSSKFGGYLDAVVDRYQEVAIYLAIAYVTGWWAASFLALTGSLLTSYNKARAAVEIPIDNNAWPDLLERLERLILICAALLLDRFVPLPFYLHGSTLFAGLLLIGALSHATALQRFWRARQLLLDARDTHPR